MGDIKLRTNYRNFNLGHQISIQEEGHREVGGEICESVITQGQVQIVKLPNLPYPLDVDPIIQIEVFIVCTKRLVCT